jgi:hypothetical protein
MAESFGDVFCIGSGGVTTFLAMNFVCSNRGKMARNAGSKGTRKCDRRCVNSSIGEAEKELGWWLKLKSAGGAKGLCLFTHNTSKFHLFPDRRPSCVQLEGYLR